MADVLDRTEKLQHMLNLVEKGQLKELHEYLKMIIESERAKFKEFDDYMTFLEIQEKKKKD